MQLPTSSLLTTTLLALSGTALSLPRNIQHPPTTADDNNNNNKRNAPLLSRRSTVSVVETVMPASTSCSGRGDECVTAEVAAPLLADAMSTYGVATGIEQAAILSIVAYESNEMQYKKNLDATQAANGKGTSNQQSGAFNVEYAKTFDALAAQNPTTTTVLDMVIANEYNFGTGPWYYSSQDACSNARAKIGSGITAWEWYSTYYMAECVGVTLDGSQPGRAEYWNNALTAFGLTNDTASS